jgi:ectoine hydroxylase-related dioxygenase (phytanoyl-CoA dioxygenase family)
MTRSPLVRDITTDEIERFDTDGIVCLRGLFSEPWINAMREAAEVGLGTPGKLHAELAAEHDDDGRFFHDTFIWTRNETCRRFVFESPAARIAAQLMHSEKINIFFDQWLIKEPGTTTKTPWHHDMTYWPIDGQQICTLWLALDSVTAKTGAVEYVKGSHRWEKRFRPASFGSGNQYTENIPEVPEIDAMRPELEIAQYDLEPGDCTVHHALTVHAAPGNHSATTRRRAHTSRWAGDDATYFPRDGLQEMPPIPAELHSGDSLDSELWPRIIG